MAPQNREIIAGVPELTAAAATKLLQVTCDHVGSQRFLAHMRSHDGGLMPRTKAKKDLPVMEIGVDNKTGSPYPGWPMIMPVWKGPEVSKFPESQLRELTTEFLGGGVYAAILEQSDSEWDDFANIGTETFNVSALLNDETYRKKCVEVLTAEHYPFDEVPKVVPEGGEKDEEDEEVEEEEEEEEEEEVEEKEEKGVQDDKTEGEPKNPPGRAAAVVVGESQPGASASRAKLILKPRVKKAVASRTSSSGTNPAGAKSAPPPVATTKKTAKTTGSKRKTWDDVAEAAKERRLGHCTQGVIDRVVAWQEKDFEGMKCAQLTEMMDVALDNITMEAPSTLRSMASYRLIKDSDVATVLGDLGSTILEAPILHTRKMVLSTVQSGEIMKIRGDLQAHGFLDTHRHDLTIELLSWCFTLCPNSEWSLGEWQRFLHLFWTPSGVPAQVLSRHAKDFCKSTSWFQKGLTSATRTLTTGPTPMSFEQVLESVCYTRQYGEKNAVEEQSALLKILGRGFAPAAPSLTPTPVPVPYLPPKKPREDPSVDPSLGADAGRPTATYACCFCEGAKHSFINCPKLAHIEAGRRKAVGIKAKKMHRDKVGKPRGAAQRAAPVDETEAATSLMHLITGS